MALVAEMRALTDRLAQSHEGRFQETTARRQEVRQKLAQWGRERVREELSLRRALRKDAIARSRMVAGTLQRAGRERTMMARRQRTLLTSETMRNRAQVRRLLHSFRGARVALAGTLSEMARIWRSFASGREAAGSRKASVQHASASLDDQIFRFLASHPNGSKTRDIERAFHAPRVSVGYAVERLIDQNRARKDEAQDVYFAT